MDINNINSLMQTFRYDCVGESRCTIRDLSSYFTEECMAKFPEIKDPTIPKHFEDWLNVSSDPEAYFQLYAVTECRAKIIKGPAEERYFDKVNIAYYVVGFDLVIITAFMVSMWIIQYLLRIDNDKYTYNTFEISEFTVEVTNLPMVGEDYPPTALKAQLVTLLQEVIGETDQ